MTTRHRRYKREDPYEFIAKKIKEQRPDVSFELYSAIAFMNGVSDGGIDLRSCDPRYVDETGKIGEQFTEDEVRKILPRHPYIATFLR